MCRSYYTHMGCNQMISKTTSIRAYFVISGFNVPPEVITSMLGVNPDESAEKGEPRERQGGAGNYQVKESFWKLHSSVSDSYSMEDYVEDLVNRLLPFSPNLENIREQIGDQSECNIFLVVGVAPESSLPGLILKPEIMSFLSKKGITLVVDMN